MGVGLTLVRQLVELHGGTVAAHSDGPGKGTEFVVRLPAVATVEPARAGRTRSHLPNTQGGRILVVEDNADSRDMLKSLLEIYGYQVAAAEDGRAWKCCSTDEFDLALVDIGLPGIDGYEVARTIRRDPQHTGSAWWRSPATEPAADRAAVKEAGFDDHLVKPLQREDLDKVLPRQSQRG